MQKIVRISCSGELILKTSDILQEKQDPAQPFKSLADELKQIRNITMIYFEYYKGDVLTSCIKGTNEGSGEDEYDYESGSGEYYEYDYYPSNEDDPSGDYYPEYQEQK